MGNLAYPMQQQRSKQLGVMTLHSRKFAGMFDTLDGPSITPHTARTLKHHCTMALHNR